MWNKVLFVFKYNTTVITLGGESRFDVISEGDYLLMTLKTGTVGKIDNSLFELVYKRYKKLHRPDKTATGSYTDPNWKNCPDRIFSPYVAAVIVFLEDNKYI